MELYTGKSIIAKSLLILASLGLVLSAVLLLPVLQREIIRFGELIIVHRALNRPVWHGILSKIGLIGFLFFSICISIVLCKNKPLYLAAGKFFNKDLSLGIKNLWINLSPVYKKSFLITFLVLNIVFALHTTTFMWGDHDWPDILYKTGDYIFFPWQLSQGRWFQTVLHHFFFDGRLLPIAANLTAFAFFSAASILLCYYWKLQKSTLNYSIAGVLFVLQPYTLGCLFSTSPLPFLAIVFFPVCGFILADRAFLCDNWPWRICLTILAAVFFWFSLGIYQVLISTIAVVFMGRVLIDFISQTNKNILHIVKMHIYSIASVILGLCLYIIEYIWLKSNSLIGDMYTNSAIKFHDIPARIIGIIKETPIEYLINYRKPFFPQSFTLIFSFLLFMALSTISLKILKSETTIKDRLINIIGVFIFFYAAFILSFTSNFISERNMMMYARMNFWGISFFHILAVIILFSQKNIAVKNISLVACLILIRICAISDFNAMKVWKIGFEAEKMEYNRIIARIETTPGYQDNKDYRVIILGATQAYRPYLYNDDSYYDTELLSSSYMAGWANNPMLVFYVYTKHSKDGVWNQIVRAWTPDVYKETITSISQEIEKAEIWPSLNSIAIKDDIMLIVLNQQGLDQAKQLLSQNEDNN
jgi:hypothetical protein